MCELTRVNLHYKFPLPYPAVFDSPDNTHTQQSVGAYYYYACESSMSLVPPGNQLHIAHRIEGSDTLLLLSTHWLHIWFSSSLPK